MQKRHHLAMAIGPGKVQGGLPVVVQEAKGSSVRMQHAQAVPLALVSCTVRRGVASVAGSDQVRDMVFAMSRVAEKLGYELVIPGATQVRVEKEA